MTPFPDLRVSPPKPKKPPTKNFNGEAVKEFIVKLLRSIILMLNSPAVGTQGRGCDCSGVCSPHERWRTPGCRG